MALKTCRDGSVQSGADVSGGTLPERTRSRNLLASLGGRDEMAPRPKAGGVELITAPMDQRVECLSRRLRPRARPKPRRAPGVDSSGEAEGRRRRADYGADTR